MYLEKSHLIHEQSRLISSVGIIPFGIDLGFILFLFATILFLFSSSLRVKKTRENLQRKNFHSGTRGKQTCHNLILNWCKNKNIFIDEQSGSIPNRRLQTRVVFLVEDVNMSIAANNRPALLVFIDFLFAFDRMWYPALIAVVSAREKYR